MCCWYQSPSTCSRCCICVCPTRRIYALYSMSEDGKFSFNKEKCNCFRFGRNNSCYSDLIGHVMTEWNESDKDFVIHVYQSLKPPYHISRPNPTLILTLLFKESCKWLEENKQWAQRAVKESKHILEKKKKQKNKNIRRNYMLIGRHSALVTIRYILGIIF